RFRTLARPGASVVRGVFVFFIAQLKNSLPNFNVGLTATEPQPGTPRVRCAHRLAASRRQQLFALKRGQVHLFHAFH
ncbi:hypothetical protein, partial [Paraburkholderia mimosarum]|uniref:hypothetical protein n=1 Tax=Paraburkholderia mimosarum TaxID=312026 RepID=UPI001ABA592E